MGAPAKLDRFSWFRTYQSSRDRAVHASTRFAAVSAAAKAAAQLLAAPLDLSFLLLLVPPLLLLLVVAL
jgi:hypothetical protein